MTRLLKPATSKDFELDITLTPAQWKIEDSSARFKVIRAGRQFGKTFWAIYKMIKCAGKKNSVVTYTGPTFSQVKKIAWERLKHQIRNMERLNGRKFCQRKPNETELSVQTVNGSVIYLLGSDNVDIARGLVVDHAILEEAAILDPRVWYEVVRPSLLYKNGGADFISTPRGFNWFKDIYDDACSVNFPDWEAFHFTIYDNPFIDRDEIEKEKNSCRSQAVWRQEYLAEFEAGGGRVFEEFAYSRHVVEDHAVPEGALVFRGIDWGLRDDTVCHWMYFHNGAVTVFDSYVQSDLPASAQAKIIISKTRHAVKASTLGADAFRVDPDLRGMSVAATFVKNGIGDLVKASMNKNAGIDLIRDLLSKDKLRIANKCSELIKQIMAYEWSKAVSVNEKTDPKAEDDCVDALRYGCQLIEMMGYLGPRKSTREKVYDVGGIRLPLRRYDRTEVRVEPSSGKVLMGV